MQTKVALYERVYLNQPKELLTPEQVLSLIREDDSIKRASLTILNNHSAAIEAGYPEGKKAYQNDKVNTLQAVLFSGAMEDKSSSADVDFKHSGLITLDIDGNGAEAQQLLYNTVLKDENVHSAALSVSGPVTVDFWASWLVEMPGGEDLSKLHKDWHDCIAEQLAAKTGTQPAKGGTLKRTRYLAHDPNAYLNPEVKRLPYSILEEWRKAKQAKRKAARKAARATGAGEVMSANAFECAVSFARSHGYDYVDGQKHNFRTHIAIHLNWLGVPQADAEAFISTNYPGDLRHSVSGPYKAYASDFGKGAHVLAQRAAKKRIQEQLSQTVKGSNIKLEKGEYLSEKAQYILSILEEKGKVHLQAGTGSGKSYMAAVELAKHTKRKIVIACSLNTKVMKDAEQYNVAAVTGAMLRAFDRQTVLNTADAAQVVLCSYEQLPRLAERYGEEAPLFVIDEVHSLSYSYRSPSLSAMWQAVQAHDVIAMTGTPLPYLSAIGFYVVKVENERPQIDWHIRHRMTGPLSGQAVEHICTADLSSTRIVALINSKEQVDATKKALLKKGFKEAEVVVLYSSDAIKASKEFKQLIDARGGKESFADQVKVVLTTSLIGEGVDVYSSRKVDFITIHREQKFNPIQLVQFADRWRTTGRKRCFTYLHQASEPEEWQKEDDYQALLFFKLRHKYLTERASLYNSKIEDINERCADQRLINTGTRFSDEERFILRSKVTGKYSVCVPSLIQEQENARAVHRTQESAINEVLRHYPYFVLHDEREEAKECEDEQTLDAANLAAQEREEAKDTLAQLTATKLDVLTQAVAMKTQDRALKAQKGNDPSLMRQARELHEKHPLLFSRFLGRAEGIIKRLLKVREMQVSDADYQRLAVQGGKLTGAKYVSQFIEGLRLHLLLLLHLNDSSGLTVQQRKDAQGIEQFIKAIQEHTGQTLSPLDVKRLVDETIGNRKRKFTTKQAGEIFSYFAEHQQVRTSLQRQVQVNGVINLSEYLTRSKVREKRQILSHFFGVTSDCTSVT